MIGTAWTRWPPALRALHWTTAAFALAMIPAAFAAQALTESATDAAEALIGFHMTAGLAILALTLARLVVRATARPVRARSAPAWRVRAARLRTLAFYALLLALPVTGILKLALSGLGVAPFGVEIIPAGPLLPGTARAFNAAHAAMAKAFIALALLHAAAGLVHRRRRP